jgi:hypothetical protein
MHPPIAPPDYLGAYYAVFLGACAIFIVSLGSILHSTGRTFLADAFAGNQPLVRAVSLLLDIGFTLVSLGYVGLFYQTNWPVNDLATAFKISITKIGGLLLVLGVAHVFNLLVLAVLRTRGNASHRASA